MNEEILKNWTGIAGYFQNIHFHDADLISKFKFTTIPLNLSINVLHLFPI